MPSLIIEQSKRNKLDPKWVAEGRAHASIFPSPVSVSSLPRSWGSRRVAEWSEWPSEQTNYNSVRLELRENSQWTGLQWCQRTRKKGKFTSWEFLFYLWTSTYAAGFHFRDLNRDPCPKQAPWRMRTDTSVPPTPSIMILPCSKLFFLPHLSSLFLKYFYDITAKC